MRRRLSLLIGSRSFLSMVSCRAALPGSGGGLNLGRSIWWMCFLTFLKGAMGLWVGKRRGRLI